MVHLKSVEALQNLVNDFLKKEIRADTDQALLLDAMQYSVNAGGKRLRPALTLRMIDAFNQGQQDLEMYLKAVCAVELLHTYSLIHDDLPAMDNDDLRRGLPTNHKKYGDAVAILAGDGLLTLAFQWLVDNDLNNQIARSLTMQLAKSAGPAGMVAGQVIDVSNEGKHLSYIEVQNLHAKKTGALIEYAMQAAGIMVNANQEVIKVMASFGGHYGLAFQIYDDLMDQIGTTAKMGKLIHKDDLEAKNTYPGLFGVEGTEQKLAEVLLLAQKDLTRLAKITPIKVTDFDDLLAYFKI